MCFWNWRRKMLRTLVMIRLKSMFAGFLGRSKKGTGTGKKILLAALVIYIVAVFGTLFINLFASTCDAFFALGMQWLYFGFTGLMIFVLCFVGSVFVTQQLLFEAKDNDLLLSMPVPVKSILISRLLSVLLLNYIYELLVLVPAVSVYIYKGHFDGAGLLFIIGTGLLLPLLVLALSALFGWLIALIDSKIGRKNLIMMVLTLALLLVYLYICMRMQHYMNLLVENGAAIGEAIERTLPPFYYMGKACAEGSFTAFGIFLLFCLIPFAVVYFALDRSFIKIATANKGRKKIEYREKALKTSGVKTALFMKDMRHFLGSPMYIFNAALGLIFMVIGAVYLFLKADTLLPTMQMLSQLTGDESIPGAALCAAFAMMASLTCISAPMISIEAKTLWISQSLPVRAKDVLFAKANVHIFTSLPFILICALLLQFSFDMGIISRVMLAAFPLAATVFNAYMGIVLNLAYPKFDWINEIDAVKQGIAPTLAIFIAMASIALPLILYLFVFKDMISAEMYLLIVFGVFVLGSLILSRYLSGKGAEKFRTL